MIYSQEMPLLISFEVKNPDWHWFLAQEASFLLAPHQIAL